MLWSAKTVARELDLLSPRAVKKLMESLGVQAIFLGPGRGRGYRWRSEDIRQALESREVSSPGKKQNLRRRETVFDQGLTVSQQIAALMQLAEQNSKGQ